MTELSKSQNVISIQQPRTKGGRAKLVKAFTESGIYMLMTVLSGDLAIEQSKTLIRLSKGMKDYLIENKFLISQHSYTALIEKVKEHSADIKEIKENMVTKAELSDFMKLFGSSVSNEEILILNGQPFKADLAYQKIFKKAKKNIIVIDDYIGIKTLHHLTKAKANTKITIALVRKEAHKTVLEENCLCRICNG